MHFDPPQLAEFLGFSGFKLIQFLSKYYETLIINTSSSK